jgi:3-dehydroquinate synthase II
LKEAWVHLEEWSKAMVTTALEGGADALILPSGLQDKVKALGLITTVSLDGGLKPAGEPGGSRWAPSGAGVFA